MKHFSIDFRSLSEQAPVEGPIPLYLEITYIGGDEVKVLDADYIDFSFQPIKGWKSKKFSTLNHLNGRLPIVTLSKGQSLSRIIYLHDHFSSLKPGRTELSIIVKIGLEGRSAEQPVILRDTCVFNIMKPNLKRFKARIKEVHSQIDLEKSAEKRLELYKSIANLSHPDLIPLFFKSLLDDQMLVFHFTARTRLVELCETYGKRELIIIYLVNHGGRYDANFFSLWNQKQIELSEEEVMRLGEASSLWVKLFCLENYDKQYNREGLVQSLKSELEELAKRTKKLGDR